MVSHEDRVLYTEKVIEASWRGGSLEINMASSMVRGIRFFDKGCWGIASSQGIHISNEELRNLALKNLRTCLSAGRQQVTELAEVKVYRGKVVLGKEPTIDELRELIESFISKAANISELVVTNYSTYRRIEGCEGACEEYKNVIEVMMSISIPGPYRIGVGTVSLAYAGTIKDFNDRKISELLNLAEERASANARAKALDPFSRGKWTIILDHECSGALFHELSHLLEADALKHLRPGTRITTLDLNIHDDPLHPWSPSLRFFDDEQVPTFKRVLVEDGTIIDLLHTRSTASLYEDAKPGSSRGLFHMPKAMHSTLIIGPGDWRTKEIIEESKKAILVSGVIRAELYEGLISIVPEVAWIIENGEIKSPVFIRGIKLPLVHALSKISAMGRDLRLRYSFEKGHIIAEASPYIRLEGYVE